MTAEEIRNIFDIDNAEDVKILSKYIDPAELKKAPSRVTINSPTEPAGRLNLGDVRTVEICKGPPKKGGGHEWYVRVSRLGASGTRVVDVENKRAAEILLGAIAWAKLT